jgi:hypothetical protein
MWCGAPPNKENNVSLDFKDMQKKEKNALQL